MLKKGLTYPLRVFRRLRAKSTLGTLTSHASPRLQAIGHALHDTLTDSLTVEERALLESIEQRRASLLASDEVIEVIDYGAGKSGTRRTQAEMAQGVPSSARIVDVTRASKERFWALFLFKLIRHLEPSSCVELGACVGISAAYQALALSLNGAGRLVTLEGAPGKAALAAATLEGMHLHNASVVT